MVLRDTGPQALTIVSVGRAVAAADRLEDRRAGFRLDHANARRVGDSTALLEVTEFSRRAGVSRDASADLRVPLQSMYVCDAIAIAGRVEVSPCLTRRRVLNHDSKLNVGEGAEEDPVVAVLSPAIEGFDEDLQVVFPEEPEGPGALAEGAHLTAPFAAVPLVFPVCGNRDHAIEEAEGSIVLNAGTASFTGSGELKNGRASEVEGAAARYGRSRADEREGSEHSYEGEE